LEKQTIEINLGDRGGNHRFESYDAVLRWLNSELEQWNWLTGLGPNDRFGLWSVVQDRFTWLRQRIVEAEANNDKEAVQQNCNQFFRSHEAVLCSEGELGKRVLEIRGSQGDEAAAMAYVIASGRGMLQAVSNIRELAGAILVAVPGALAPQAVAAKLSSERRNLRDRADRLIAMLEDQAEVRQQEYLADRRRGRDLASRWVRRRFGRWQAVFEGAVRLDEARKSAFMDASTAISQELATTKTTYEEAMRLQAPATYWRDKANAHGVAENSARGRLYWFFPLAFMSIAAAFWFTGAALLDKPPPPNSTALYFVISGGLATLIGVIFWIGRLLTKLYLSEHHLRIDAEEREIMTSTYLALTHSKAAEESDRQIILAALFRSTPDGIVRDDGPADLNLAMLLSRIGVPGKA
jgi:hypothetical protein